ncbi:MAG TPA: THUMP domain-containing protein [Gammaproteobacteria bacterium]|jgi:tRNA(Ser,Leu) C12 N-acetylase TAN1
MTESPFDWNVVVTVYDGEFNEAVRLLRPYGEVARTDYWNVLAMRVEDVAEFVQALESATREDATIPNAVARIVPVTAKFRFQSPAEFEEKTRALVERWLSDLKGKSFHVRMHRRGFKGRLSSQHEEQFLDHHLLERLTQEGGPGRIDFADPDVIIAVETLGQTAGLSLWTREQRQSFELLDLD